MWNLSPATYTSRIHLNMEQFSLETNWKLAERVLYDQDCKKDPHVIGEEGRKSDQAGIPGGGTLEKGHCPGKWWEPDWGPEPWGPTRERWAPCDVGGPPALGELWKLRPCLWGARVPRLAQEAGREASCSCLGVCRPSLTKCSSPAYPPSQHGPGSRVATMREGKQRDTEATWSQDGTWVGSSGYCWSLHKECIRSSPDLWRQLTLNTWAHRLQLPAMLPIGRDGGDWGRRKAVCEWQKVPGPKTTSQ